MTSIFVSHPTFAAQSMFYGKANRRKWTSMRFSKKLRHGGRFRNEGVTSPALKIIRDQWICIQRGIVKKWFSFKGLFLICCLVVGTFIFINLFNPQREIDYKVQSFDSVDGEHFKMVLSNLLGPSFVPGNRVQGLYNGEQIFPSMLNAIHGAKHTITFESYIYWSGEIGQQFADALAERAKAGVKVHVLIDWLGSQKINEKFISLMQDSGVEVEWYHPLHWYTVSRMNNRTHRKILVIDGRIGFTGGVGIADEWEGNGLDPKRWRDTHYRVEGPVVHQMQSTFMDNWLKVRPEVHQTTEYFPAISPVGESWAQMFKSSSREGSSSVHIMYLLAIKAARKSIYIENAYFVPDNTTIEALVEARSRGVEVVLVAPGPHIDAKVVRLASREQWETLLEAGVKIYEYQKAMFHCKVLVVDSIFVSVGSTNFDERSFRLNDEANLNVLDKKFAEKEIDMIAVDIQRSKLITLTDWKNRPFLEKIIEKIMITIRSQL